ncbi:MAG: alpha-1,2-fucosyltransferase [Verrucomicrobia bacterium]|nr:alpha-1,2-fucosyltransferase [Verrucomicrobiota bacterium]
MNSENRPFISPIFNGQIGNQLFIVAATLAYAWDYGAIPYFPGLFRKENRTSYNKDRLFFRLDTSPVPRPFKNHYRETAWYSSQRIPFREDQLIEGYFQSWKHFHHHRDKLLSILAPSEFTMNCLNQKYSDLMARSDTVGVHVRTEDIRVHASSIPFVGLQYYRDALELFPRDMTFVVFSDRINWCKHQFPKFDRKFIFIEGNYGIEDMFLMAKCKHMIIPNSTLSWWGAYLNQNPGRTIVAPESSWLTAPVNPRTREDQLLPDWKSLPFDIEPYPTDMYDYDRTSLSEDNNFTN